MQKITFDAENHQYYIDGVEVPSVTTVCRFLAYDQKSDKPRSEEHTSELQSP